RDPRPCIVLYSCRDPQTAALLPDLADWSAKNPRMSLHVTMTSSIASAWKGLRGRLDRNLLKVLLAGRLDAQHYVAGPEAFVDDVSDALLGLGVDASRITLERFFAYEALV